MQHQKYAPECFGSKNLKWKVQYSYSNHISANRKVYFKGLKSKYQNQKLMKYRKRFWELDKRELNLNQLLQKECGAIIQKDLQILETRV